MENESEKEGALKKVSQSMKDFEESMNAYLAMPRAPRAKEIFKEVEQTWPELQRVLHEVLELAHSKDAGKQVQAESLYIREGRPRVGRIVETIQKLNDERRKMMETETTEDLAASSNSVLFMVTGGAVAILISLVTMIAVINFIIRHMNGITENLFSSAASLTTASQQLSTSSTEVAASSSETAASIQETVAYLEEMTSMVKTTDENSQLSLDLTHKTHQQAQKSEAKLNELTTALSEISASASKITDIIQVIDNISFRTNGLAPRLVEIRRLSGDLFHATSSIASVMST
ncbi:MAG: MCP four helix bundle domain-containing protein [Bdellovibrionales bacterium]